MKKSEGESGFTLLELVIALGVLSIAIGGLLSVFGAALRTTAVDIHRTDAVALANQELVSLRALQARAVPVPAPRQATINGQTYSVTDTATWQRSSGGDNQAYRAVAVAVTWIDQGAAHSVTQSSAVVPSSVADGASCGAPDAAVGAAASSGGASAGVTVTWTEPSSAVPIDHWEIDVSPDGGRWTAAVRDEATLVPGAQHAVELGGLTPRAAYSIRIGGVDRCGAATWVGTGAAASGAPAEDCGVASTTLGPAVASRMTSAPDAGLLTGGVDVEVAASGPCPGGLWARVMTSNGSVATALLAADGIGYSGTLPGITGPWDLGRHDVEIFSGMPTAGAPGPTTPLAVAVLCVEPEGTPSC